MLTKSRAKPPAKPPVPTPAPASPGGASLLLAGLDVRGDLTTEDDVQIDGAITGNVRAAGLTVGEGARIEGEVVAMTLRVHGTIEGTVRANWVELAATAVVKGDVLHGSLRVEPGAQIDGRVCCLENPTRSAHAEAPVPATDAVATDAAKPSPKPKAPGERSTDDAAPVPAAVIEVPSRRAAAG